VELEKVRVGVIGVGLWGLCHAEAYLGLLNAELVAVADSSPGRAEAVARSLNVPRWFENYEALCELKEIDAVSIVTPESEHLKPVETAAGAGKHILVEKPIARSLTDIDRMIAATEKANVILLPGHLLRFETRYALIKEKLDRHELGRVVTIRARRNRTKGNFQKYARAHPVFAVAVHDIDIALWYIRSRPKRVRGFQRNIQDSVTPDVFWGIIEFTDGALAVIETTWLTPDRAGIFSNDALEVITDQGVAMLDLVPGGLSLWLESGFEVPDIIGAPRIRGSLGGSLAAELAYFVSCVQGLQKPGVVSAEEAKEGIRIALALIQSAETQKDISL
jgi:UDP-N-acetylglucosamine 3-dehydrogenase